MNMLLKNHYSEHSEKSETHKCFFVSALWQQKVDYLYFALNSYFFQSYFPEIVTPSKAM